MGVAQRKLTEMLIAAVCAADLGVGEAAFSVGVFGVLNKSFEMGRCVPGRRLMDMLVQCGCLRKRRKKLTL